MPLILAISMECVVLKECKRTCRITATNKSTHIIHIVVSSILSFVSILHTRPKLESINLDGYLRPCNVLLHKSQSVRQKYGNSMKIIVSDYGEWACDIFFSMYAQSCVCSHVGQMDFR